MSGTESVFQAGDALPDPGPAWRGFPFRIAMTTGCRDCDHIPKVAGAGTVVEENGQRVQIMHNGVRVIAGGYDGDWMTEIITRLRGHHEPQEELVFHEILKTLPEQATMIELGGYWSYYTLWFLHAAPQHRRAIVVEPDPRYLDVGRRNAALNRRDVDFIQAAVGETAADRIEFPSQSSGPVLIPQVSVAGLMESRDIQCLDILHCDTQGAETAVIKSCARLFQEHRIRFAVFSTHEMEFTGDPLTHQRCLAMIRAYGGHILAEHEVHESYSGDGLIAAYFGSAPISWPALNMSYNRYSNSLFRNPIYDLPKIELVHAQNVKLEAENVKLEAEKSALERSQAEWAEKYNKLSDDFHTATGFHPDFVRAYPELKPDYFKLYEMLRRAQRSPLRAFRRYMKWKLYRSLLRFAPMLPERLAQKTRRGRRKYQPLPQLSVFERADAPSLLLNPADPPPIALYRFFADKKYQKRATSKLLLLFSPVLSSRFKDRLRRRYEKSRDREPAPSNSQAIASDGARTTIPALTESAQSFFEDFEARLASISSSKTVK